MIQVISINTHALLLLSFMFAVSSCIAILSNYCTEMEVSMRTQENEMASDGDINVGSNTEITVGMQTGDRVQGTDQAVLPVVSVVDNDADTVGQQDHGSGRDTPGQQDRGRGRDTAGQQNCDSGRDTAGQQDHGRGRDTAGQQDRGRGRDTAGQQNRDSGRGTAGQQNLGSGRVEVYGWTNKEV